MTKQEKTPKQSNKTTLSAKKDQKKKSTMKMQKKHTKQEKTVKDIQLKIGPTKRIQKVDTSSTASKKIATTTTTTAALTKKETTPTTSSEPLVELRDTVKDKLAQNKVKKIDQGALKKAITKLEAKRSRVPLKETAQNCTLYVGHLPYGLLEDQLKQYFNQYGTIKHVKLARSRKTSRSKGYAFIMFDHPEVAAIAAKAMHGHMVLGKVLDVHVLQSDQKNPFAFKDGKKQYKFINWRRLFIASNNLEKNPEALRNQVIKLLKNERKRRENIKKLGIDYEFPGFQAIVESTETHQSAADNDNQE